MDIGPSLAVPKVKGNSMELIPPSYQDIKIKKNKTFDVTITVKKHGKWRYDSVLGSNWSQVKKW